MNIALLGLAFFVSLACAIVMGFAIQRGATCTVVAMAEVVSRRRFTRLGSMVEASLWVLGGLVGAQALHLLPAMPAGYAIDAYTILGGALLGVGAYVGRACVFGAIARLGSGEWSYVATPLGFYAGCAAFAGVHLPARQPVAHGSPVFGASTWVALVCGALLVLRAVPALRRDAIVARAWSPHVATVVIGIAYFWMLLLVGPWSYTEALAEVARGMASNTAARTLLLLGLLAGTMLGGWTAGRLRSRRVTVPELARCFIGGALMAWGSLLIPGGNDGLILVGMPLLWPYAWAAFATMCASIGAALLVERSRAATRSTPAQSA